MNIPSTTLNSPQGHVPVRRRASSPAVGTRNNADHIAGGGDFWASIAQTLAPEAEYFWPFFATPEEMAITPMFPGHTMPPKWG